MSDDFEISKIVKLVPIKEAIQSVIINGVKQDITQVCFTICCPECGRAIYKFPPDEDKLTCVTMIMQNKEDLTKHFQYCPECGQKLNYNFDIFKGDVK